MRIWSDVFKEMRAIESKPKKKAREKTPSEVSKLIFENLDEAQRSVSTEEQTAYQEAQQSVVDARRSAERHEGILRIN